MKSKGEQALLEVLSEELGNYPILEQFPIKIGRKTLYFDYYVPMLKLAFEFDGIQHFQPNKFFFKTLDKFLNYQKNDKDKERYCVENHIALVRLRDTDQKCFREKLRAQVKIMTNMDRHDPLYEE